MSESSRDYYLKAILAEIGNIRSFVAGYDFGAYAKDLKAQYATERAILNMSEAVRNLEKHSRRSNPDFNLSSISHDIEWANIKGIGNVMRHDYENVSSSKVWAVVANHLDSLERACRDALGDGP